jgi:hypothetical protein
MADDIKIRVGVQNNVKTGMDSAVKSVSQSARQMAGGFGGAFRNIMGGIGFMAVATGIRNLIRDVSDLKDAAAQVDFDPRNFQIVKAVAEDAGVGSEQLTAALGRLMKASSEVGSNKQMQEAFAALGISIDDVLSSNPEQLFQKIATGFAQTGDKAAVFDLFGRGAQKLIPTLRELAGGFDAVANRGDIISNDDLNRLDAMDDKLNKIGRTLKSLGAAAVSGTVGFIEKVAARMGAISAGDTPEAGDRSRAAEDDAERAKQAQAVEDKRIADEYAANRQREIYATQEKIKAVESENEVISTRGSERQRQAIQDADERQRLTEEAKAAAFDPGTMGRLMGQGGRDMQAQADYATRMALDNDFRRRELQQQRQVDRAERRRKQIVSDATKSLTRWGFDKGTTGMSEADWKAFEKRDPRAARVLKAEAAQAAAEANKQNLEQLQRRAAEAAIQAQKDTAVIAKNTAAIKDLKDSLVVGGGG